MKPNHTARIGLFLLALPLPVFAADLKISELPGLSAGSVVPSTDKIPIVNGGATKSVTPTALFSGWGFTTAGADMAKAADAAAQRILLDLGNAATLDLASQAEAEAGSSSTKLMTPQRTAQAIAELGGGGGLTIASQAEAEAGTENTHYMTPLRTAQAIAELGGGGGLTLATQAEAEAGTENTHYMTPLRTAQAVTEQASAKFTDSDSLAALLSDESGSGFFVRSNEPGLTDATLNTPTINAATIVGGAINLGSDATGDLYFRDAGGALERLPIGSAGQFLKVTSGLPSWATLTGGGDMLAANNLSELANFSAARSNLGLVIGTNVQAHDSDLDTWAGKTAPSGAVVGISDTQTLTNKTHTSPVINVGSDATGDLYYRDAGGAFTRLGIGSTGNVLTVASGLPSWASPGGLTHWTESNNTSSPNNSVNATRLIPSASVSANADVVIEPKGTGAILGQLPDGTTTGGNKRGTSAVDFQRERGSAGQVASGSVSVIAGGGNNTASGFRSSILGGYGNTATQNYCVVTGGQANHATGNTSIVVGGQNNLADGDYSMASGFYAKTRGILGMEARASARHVADGDAQVGRYTLLRSTSDATQTELSASGAAPNSALRITMPNNSTYSFTGQVSARSSGGDAAAWRFTGTIERGANAATTAIIGTVTATDTQAEAGASSWSIAVDADTTNGGLRVRVTGAAATNIRWLALVETVELTY